MPDASAKMRAASTNGTLPDILRSMASPSDPPSTASSSPRQLSGGRLASALSDICFRKRGLARARVATSARSASASRGSPQSARKSKKILAARRLFGSPRSIHVANADSPFVEACTPPRVHRHDIALAERIAAAVQRLVDLARERQQPRPYRIRRERLVVRGEDEAVVLVRRDRLLAAALGSHPEPAQGKPGEVVRGRLELEDAHGDLVVEARDHPRQLQRRPTLRDERQRERADISRAVDQRGNVRGAPDRRRDLAHR